MTKQKNKKWYRSFSSRAGNILVRKSCRNKSVYGDYRCLYIGVGGGSVECCDKGEMFFFGGERREGGQQHKMVIKAAPDNPKCIEKRSQQPRGTQPAREVRDVTFDFFWLSNFACARQDQKKRSLLPTAQSRFFFHPTITATDSSARGRLHGIMPWQSPQPGSADDPLSTLPSANGLLQSGRR